MLASPLRAQRVTLGTGAAKLPEATDAMDGTLPGPPLASGLPVGGRIGEAVVMRGLMQPAQLTLVHAFERAERFFPGKEVVTVTKDGRERTTYGEWAQRTRRLAGVLDDLGVSADGRVGTFAWNTARHLELYFAAPCSGRVLHTLNIRLFPEQVVFVANHAEDEVVFVDRSLLPLLWPLVDELETVSTS